MRPRDPAFAWERKCYCIISLSYESLLVSIGVDEASRSGSGSSLVDAPPTLRVPSAEVPSAQRHFLGMIASTRRIPNVGRVGWS